MNELVEALTGPDRRRPALDVQPAVERCRTAAMPDLDIVERWIGDNPRTAVAPDLAPPIASIRPVSPTPGPGLTVDERKVRALAIA
ncbi:hypothetical protein [Dactylosporangium matsuzakiense]|uniref:Uncharacterized protein n=1 Tax=Dactylosporangium matsuzakiense TaxID=53360 RepID=A0A9W6KQ47_9ACTN|nr:hypothetical protein [Dactylosporangium matsuzakiense]UWZ48350.1 hypothetical protein Dmats_19235 [Dactylosporangium matsuzakiense]GLL05498.1 hypothetical protein GCM10017581_072450 [Dactylosporangium matsuzakiense]